MFPLCDWCCRLNAFQRKTITRENNRNRHMKKDSEYVWIHNWLLCRNFRCCLIKAVVLNLFLSVRWAEVNEHHMCSPGLMLFSYVTIINHIKVDIVAVFSYTGRFISFIPICNLYFPLQNTCVHIYIRLQNHKFILFQNPRANPQFSMYMFPLGNTDVPPGTHVPWESGVIEVMPPILCGSSPFLCNLHLKSC